MQAVLFEEPFYLACWSIVVLGIVAGVWMRFRTPASQRTLAATMCVVPALFIMQAVVETDRERLETLTRRLAEWVETGDIDAILARCRDHDGAFGELGGRQALAQQLDRLLRRYEISNARVRGFDITIDGSQAQLRCSSVCDVAAGGMSRPYVQSSWRIFFDQVGGTWMIADLVPIKVAGQSYKTLAGIP
jgi:hypothetical protein